MKRPFKVVNIDDLFYVLCTERDLLSHSDVCISILNSKDSADHLCGKLNDVVDDVVALKVRIR